MDAWIPPHRAVQVTECREFVDPYSLLPVLPPDQSVALLENPGIPSALGRYAFLCADPFLSFRTRRRQAWVGPPGREQQVDGEPLEVFKRLLARAGGGTRAWRPGLPPLLGGAVGYLGYELLYLLEEVPDLGRDDVPVPDSLMVFYSSVVASDLVERRSWIITTEFADSEAKAAAAASSRQELWRERLGARLPAPRWDPVRVRSIRQQRLKTRPSLSETAVREAGFQPVLSGTAYRNLVDAAKEHIVNGDIFEVCTSNRFDGRYTGDGAELYSVLRSINPAPFAAYLRSPGIEVMSSSPERFVSLDREGWASTRPIKGTRPRSQDPLEDRRLHDDLASAEKDRAENIMIVDLARNDLGRICRFGTVRAPEVAKVESYAFTHQLVSTIRGQLRPDCGPIELIRAAFPGGSMTGAPKVEAMKIIDRLEPVKRGVFAGSIGYFDFDGAVDLSIVIRTLVKTGDRLTFHVGGAIVADSDAGAEYQETLDKAHALVTAYEIATGAFTEHSG